MYWIFVHDKNRIELNVWLKNVSTENQIFLPVDTFANID